MRRALLATAALALLAAAQSSSAQALPADSVRSNAASAADDAARPGADAATPRAGNDEGRGFERALTVGLELAGSGWGRADDAVAIAAGVLGTGSEYRGATADAEVAGYAASGSEVIGELYYRWRVDRLLDATPDLQWIRRPGGNRDAGGVWAAAVRARLGV